MSLFKEIVKRDIKQTFMNLDEFGELHKLNGKERLIIIDENELTEREKRTRTVDAREGMHVKQLLFYIAAVDFGPLPSPGKILDLDGKKYVIMDAENEDGVYSISMEAIRS